MTTQNLLKPLHDTLEKAHELARLAQAEEWSKLEVEFANYEGLAKRLNDEIYLKELANNNLEESAKELILQIQVLNENLDLGANNARDNVASEIRQMVQSNKALDAYRR